MHWNTLDIHFQMLSERFLLYWQAKKEMESIIGVKINLEVENIKTSDSEKKIEDNNQNFNFFLDSCEKSF